MKKRTYKNKKQKSSFGFLHIFVILALAAGITIICMSLLMPPKKKETDDPKPLDTAVNETEQKQREEKTKEEKKEEGENPDKTPEKYDGENKVSKETFNASITKSEIVNGKFILRVSIYELVNDGTCKLHMEEKHGSMLDQTAKIVNAGPDSSACEGFDIPVDGIASGSYTYTVTMTNGQKTTVLNGSIAI